MDRDAFLHDAATWADALIHGRRTTLPRRLVEPGPDAAQRQRIVAAAAAAPDHGQLCPWRFIEIGPERRDALADAFASALQSRDPGASEADLARAREKAYRAPWLLLAVASLPPDNPEVPAPERLLSLGAAVQNMLLMATALGLGSGLTSGKALTHPHLRALCRLAPHEEAICFIGMGQMARRPPAHARPRPAVADYFSRL